LDQLRHDVLTRQQQVTWLLQWGWRTFQRLDWPCEDRVICISGKKSGSYQDQE